MADKKAHLKPNSFVGIEGPAVLENWINELNKLLFETIGFRNNQRVAHATLYLRETSNHWWPTIRATLETQLNFM